jgi:hypothetical protein
VIRVDGGAGRQRLQIQRDRNAPHQLVDRHDAVAVAVAAALCVDGRCADRGDHSDRQEAE